MLTARTARLVVELAQAVARDAATPAEVLEVVDRCATADIASLARFSLRQEPSGTLVHGDTQLTEAEERRWQRELPLHPYAQWLTSSPLPASRLTDVVDMAVFERSRLYTDLLAPRGARYQTGLILERTATGATILSTWRHDRDFDDAEMERFEVLRRALAAAYRMRRESEALLELAAPRLLTPRQEQVVALVALGLTNDQVARRLGLATRTVRKHLEAAFVRCEVHSRAGITAWWWRQGGRSAT